MKLRFRKQSKNCSRGQTLITLVILLVSLVALSGLAIEAGRVYTLWNGLSRALDAACAAALKRAPALSDEAIEDLANKVARFNLSQQSFNLSNVSIVSSVIRNPDFANLFKISIAGNISNIPLTLMRLIQALGVANLAATSKCPTCYNNPQGFTVDANNFYEGGLDCQKICNDGTYTIPGTEACCDFMHGWMSGQEQNTCVCATSSAKAINTDNCDPNAQAPEPVNPVEPGIAGPVWINRTDENQLAEACHTECINRGNIDGILWCNEGCREEEGTVCCKCHCMPNPVC